MSERHFAIGGAVLLGLVLGELVRAIARHPERMNFVMWGIAIAITWLAVAILYVMWTRNRKF